MPCTERGAQLTGYLRFFGASSSVGSVRGIFGNRFSNVLAEGAVLEFIQKITGLNTETIKGLNKLGMDDKV